MLKGQIIRQISILIVVALTIQRVTASPNLQIPSSFGLIASTRHHQNDYPQFQLFLSRYATMKCQTLTEINIIWFFQQSPDQLKIQQKSNQWIRPVNFQRPPTDSVNWHFKVPPKSQARVYFSISDDIIIDCQQLTKGFRVWQAHALSQIGPIISYKSGIFEYQNKGGFRGMMQQQKQYFSIGFQGLGFISRHFMELYYLNTWELKKLRKFVGEMNDCDNIGLNWLVQYYYPELKTIIISGNFQAMSSVPAQLNVGTQNKSKCIDKFTRIFGINPLRYSPIDSYSDSIRTLVLRNQSVLIKKQYFDKNGFFNSKDNTAEINLNLENQRVMALRNRKDIESNNRKLKQQAQNCKRSLINVKKMGVASSHLPTRSNDEEVVMKLRQQLAMTIFIELGLLSTVLVLFWKLMAVCQINSSRGSSPLPVSEEAADIVIISPLSDQLQ